MTDSLTPASRVANLDLLRAVAIGLVVLCNAAVESAASSPAVEHLLLSGWMGVDLFFVLSGWLVGGLYWRERSEYGNVQLGRFWARRWLRTIPPYLVALHAVWALKHVVLHSGTPYSVAYLFFLQNYIHFIPYWAVSWSLCVEEHVYLALPLVLGVATRIRGSVLPILGSIAVASLLARLMTPVDLIDGISGPLYTETHLRLEGIVFGVAASYVYAHHAAAWTDLQAVCRKLVVPALGALLLVIAFPTGATLRIGFTLVDLSMAILLIAVADREPLRGASSRVVKAVALTSYSVYMTHTAVLEGVSRLADGVPLPARFVLAVALIGAVGAAFYALVERPTLWLRERWVPRRAGVGLSAPRHDAQTVEGEAPVLPSWPETRSAPASV